MKRNAVQLSDAAALGNRLIVHAWLSYCYEHYYAPSYSSAKGVRRRMMAAVPPSVWFLDTWVAKSWLIPPSVWFLDIWVWLLDHAHMFGALDCESRPATANRMETSLVTVDSRLARWQAHRSVHCRPWPEQICTRLTVDLCFHVDGDSCLFKLTGINVCELITN